MVPKCKEKLNNNQITEGVSLYASFLKKALLESELSPFKSVALQPRATF